MLLNIATGLRRAAPRCATLHGIDHDNNRERENKINDRWKSTEN